MNEKDKKTIKWSYIPTENHDAYEFIFSPLGLYCSLKADTLITLLSKQQEIIISEFDKETRYEIKRSIKEDYIYECNVVPSKEDLNEFLKVYKDFYLEKKLNLKTYMWYEKELSKRRLDGVLIISKINTDDNILIYHLYSKESDNRIRLTCSASCFRDFDSKLKSKNGRINRLSHWLDMLQFKKMGYQFYDWGGVNLDKSLEIYSVAKFKFSFSKIIETRYIADRNASKNILNKTDVLLKGTSNELDKEICIELCNVVSDKYRCYTEKKDGFKGKIINIQSLPYDCYGMNPLVFYYMKKREGDFVFGCQKKEWELALPYNMKTIYIDETTNNEVLNWIDIAVYDISDYAGLKSLINGMAAGIFPIIVYDKNKTLEGVEELVSYGCTLTKIENWEDKIIELIKSCELNIKGIRQKQEKIAKYVFENRSWEVLTEKIEQLIEQD